MKKFLSFGLFLAAVACGGEDTTELFPEYEGTVEFYDPHPEIPVPGQEGRIDGSPWIDGLFNSEESREVFCDEYGYLPDAWFCSDTGQVQMGFSSQTFHGTVSGGGTCYGPQTKSDSSQNCVFPDKKQFKVKINTSNCFTGSPPPSGPSTLEEQNYLNAMREGIKMWNGVGGLTVVNDGAFGAENYRLIEIRCGTPSGSTALAEGGLAGSPTDRGDMPSKFIGGTTRDPKQARIVNGTWFLASPSRMYSFGVTRCGSGDGSMNLRTATVKYVAAHEAGHIFGFSHFGSTATNNIMDPFTNECAPTISFAQAFADALSAFNPGSGSPSVSNGSLGNLSPL